MNERDFMKQVSSSRMPDIEGVKQSCLERLNAEEQEPQRIRRMAAPAAAAAAALLCLCILSATVWYRSIGSMGGGLCKSDFAPKGSEQRKGIVPENGIAEEHDEEQGAVLGKAGTAEEKGDTSGDAEDDPGISGDAAVTQEGESGDLVHRQEAGAVMSMEQGEQASITVEDGKQYTDVFIVMAGQSVVQDVGLLDAEHPCTFIADIAGDYMIYAGEKQENITEEVVIVYSGGATAQKLIPLQ